MSIRSNLAAIASALTIVAVLFTGLGTLPAAASSGKARITCAGPTRTERSFLAHAKAQGLKAQEMLYNRGLIGCIPLAANGKPKANLLQNALRQQRALGVYGARHGKVGALPPIGPKWTSIGPSPIGSGASADSGRILSMTYDASLGGGTLFIGTAQGGVWSSTSPFTSWATHTDGMPNLAIGSIAVDPSVAGGTTLYAGTGEQANGGYDGLYGGGVYKSTDGGATWAAVAGTWGQTPISKIVVSSTGTVFVSQGTSFAGGGIQISTNGGATWGGAPAPIGANSVTDLAIDSSNNVDAAVSNGLTTQAQSGVYRCTSPCTAASVWSLIGGGSGGLNGFPASASFNNMKLTAVPTTAGGGGTAIYAVLSNSAAVVGPPAHGGGTTILGVWRLLPGSATWSQVASYANSENYENQAWYDLYIWADPNDASGATVYFGLSNIYKTTTGTGVGPTWTDLTNVYNGGSTGVHPDQHYATSNGGSTVFFGNDGGIWSSTDGGATFNDLNGNLTTLQFYGGDVGTNASEGCTSNCDATARIGGMQDNGTAQTTGGATSWSRAPGFGDGGQALIDPNNNNNRYGENANGGIVNSQDGFVTANDATTGGTCGTSNFYAPMRLDPGTPTTLFAGMRDLCQTTNANTAAPTWTDISSGITSVPLSAIAVSDAGGQKIYIGDNSGHTFFTINDGTTWTSMDLGLPGGPLAAVGSASGSGPAPFYGFGLALSGLAADPTTAGVVYATVNGFQGSSANHVFKWTNTGGPNGTWTDISGNLPDEPYDCVAVNPAAPSEIFVGGITGVFVTKNGGATWNQMGTGLPNVQVDGLNVTKDGTTLIAFTHGRSAWQIVGTPTASYSASFKHRVTHGWTYMSWRSTGKVAGFNVYNGTKRLNHKLVTSRTNHYSFAIHKVVRKPRVVAVPVL
jgi:hypothetical protein